MPTFDVYMNGRVTYRVDASDAASAIGEARKCAHDRCLRDYTSFLDVARAMRPWRAEPPYQNVVLEARPVEVDHAVLDEVTA